MDNSRTLASFSKVSTSAVNWKELKRKRKEEKKMKLMKKAKKLSKMKEAKEADASDASGVGNKRGRNYTVSIAVPGSIIDNAQSLELKTCLAGQIARSAAIYNVDEIVVFDEYGVFRNSEELNDTSLKFGHKHRGCALMIKILQYLECPQYLRKYYFPISKDLEFAGLLNPLDIPHHLRVTDVCRYREGTVLNKPVRDGKGSYVYIGLYKSAVIDKAIEPHVRVTVKLDEEQKSKKHFKGTVVSPSTPCKDDGIYWGYNVRGASTFATVFSECPYKGGYDLIIGTSDKGDSIDNFSMPSFKHLLIVFGGLKGLETCLEADETLEINNPNSLFHHYLNTCPEQGSRTIRTEEATLITLSTLRPFILQAQRSRARS